MIAVSVVAIAVNIYYCLYLLSANAEVILAGILVMLSKSGIPDLVIEVILAELMLF